MKTSMPGWSRYLPSPLRNRIEHQPHLIKILSNIGWLFLDKALRLVVGLLVGIWLARYLGPKQFGQFNYAIAFVSLFGAIATLGLNSIVVRDIVREPDSAPLTLGTAFALQLLSSIIAVVLIVCTISWLRPEDNLSKTMVAIIGFGLVLKTSEVIKYWFESQVQSKYVVWVENVVFLLIATVKIVMILRQAPLIAFVWLVLVEAVLVAFALFAVYIKQGGRLMQWSVQAQRAMSLLKDSWPLILSGIVIMIYMRVDQIMLGEIVGNEAVGIYSAALRISEIWYMIPMVIVASVFPAISKSKNVSNTKYIYQLQRLYDLMVACGITIAILITIASPWIIRILFGEEYVEASAILAIHVWTLIFVFLGVASGKWYLLENLQIHAFYRAASGGVVNILLNLLLIPHFGGMGAACATLASQFTATYLYDSISRKTRHSFTMKTASLFPFIRKFRI